MIRCEFVLQTSDKPSDWAHLDFADMHSIPVVGSLIGPTDRATEWTRKHSPDGAPVLLWRVTNVIQHTEHGGVLIAVIPCLTLQEDGTNATH
jgi:hypothetical protein